MYYAEDGKVKAQQVYEKGKLVKEKIEEGFEVKEFKEDLEEDDIIEQEPRFKAKGLTSFYQRAYRLK